MKLPITFDDFKSNPIGAISFCLVIAVGFLGYELRKTYELQVESQNNRIESLEGKITEYENRLEKLNEKLIECVELQK